MAEICHFRRDGPHAVSPREGRAHLIAPLRDCSAVRSIDSTHRAPGRALPGLAEINGLVRHLAVPPLHDVDGVCRPPAGVGEDQLGNPEIAVAAHAFDDGLTVAG
jgi:hypothetical protein